MTEPYDIHPGRGWRTARRVTQSLALLAILVGPILGGWQRAERGTLSAWQMRDWDLPEWLAGLLPSVPGEQVYEANVLMGGGGGVEYFSLPVSDPVVGSVALIHGQSHLLAVVAWLIPIVLALAFGRVFCGWFCPFGMLARGIDRLLSLLPFEHRGFDLPERRPVRWFILFAAILGGALGGEWFAYAMLPHVLVQASFYSILLLGGLGAVGGAAVALIAIGLLFGPTLYCAAICPTGAVLGLLGRARRVHVYVPEPGACGSCTLCHRACWIGLEPARGQGPGPDCDLCTRCFTACPKSKMVVRFGPPERPTPPKKKHGALAALILLASMGLPGHATAADTSVHKPELVLAGFRETPEFTAAVTVVDRTGVRFTLDTEPEAGSVVSAYVVKGPKNAIELEGRRAKDGVVHEGPLTIRLATESGVPVETLEFTHPTAPISTPNRTIYRRRVPHRLDPGDTVTLDAVPGIFDTPIRWTIPEVRPARDGRFAWFLVAGVLFFAGLLALSVGFGIDGRASTEEQT